MSTNNLHKLFSNLKALDERKFVELGTVLNTQFFTKHTRFNNFDEFIKTSGFKVESQEDFKAIPDDEFDSFVSENTPFSSWKNMQVKAFKLYAHQLIMKGIK
ncbi:hypothetical protein [Vibrio aestuarianus]|uniref:Uncharacterized protein n=1 Tax=Vibrio aestuarianus TaxID=28171 RepID=A0ABN8TUE1_9VIBR|nr:hypothetical protein [Vibrio aestuarianus]MDE1215073.1 hypothetical protein [Vibrio aestuarianus]MDE1217847.1 hypothetical protein [Vibrio aestuarianus]MDE1226380.1 hypothetical protein [Vibrio aestuarianus]MDE1257584.1 hypothetical protein [Vibrio aestuarianus]MDE1262177.1 hypothetical protein [Vibrio aestuarianus]